MLTGIVPRSTSAGGGPPLGRVVKGVVRARHGRRARGSPGCCWGSSPGDGVLDVACGTGNFTRDFARTVGPGGPRGGPRRVPDDARHAPWPTRARRGWTTGSPTCAASAQEPAVPGRELRRGLLLRRAAPVRGPDARAGPHGRGAHPGGGWPIFTTAAAARRPCGGRSGPLAHAAARPCSSAARWSTRWSTRGFEDVRQRITGVTQFVGGRLELARPARRRAGRSGPPRGRGARGPSRTARRRPSRA